MSASLLMTRQDQGRPHAAVLERGVRRRWHDRRLDGPGRAQTTAAAVSTASAGPTTAPADPVTVLLVQPVRGRAATDPGRVATRATIDVLVRYGAMCGVTVDPGPGDAWWDAGVGAAPDRPTAHDLETALGCLPGVAATDRVDSVWWVVAELFAAGLLSEHHAWRPWCPGCADWCAADDGPGPAGRTAAWVRFPIATPGGLQEAGASLAVHLSTPWLLPAVTAVTIADDADPVLARAPADDYPVVVPRARVDAVLGPQATIHRPVGREELDGVSYRHPLDCGAGARDPGRRDVVVIGPAPVDSGAVAPAYRTAHHQLAQRHGLATADPVTDDGRFDATAGPCAGVAAADAGRVALDALEARGLLLSTDRAPASEAVCARCATPTVERVRSAWALTTGKRRDDIAVARATVGGSTRAHGVRGLDGGADWTITRTSGDHTPLPLWRCDACASVTAVASRAELAGRPPGAGEPLGGVDDGGIDRPLACSACPDGTAVRIPLTIDPLVDAAALPFARFGFPHAAGSDAQVAQRCHATALLECGPADGWADAVLTLALLLWDAPTHDAVTPLPCGSPASGDAGRALAERGADTVRWAAVTAPSRMTDERALDTAADLLDDLWDAASQCADLADRTGWTLRDWLPEADSTVRDDDDLALLRRLSQAVAHVRADLDGRDVPAAAAHLRDLVGDLARWRNDRLADPAGPVDPAVLATFHESLVTTAALLAPFAPFLAEELYERLVRAEDPGAPDSVHRLRYPTADPATPDAHPTADPGTPDAGPGAGPGSA